MLKVCADDQIERKKTVVLWKFVQFIYKRFNEEDVVQVAGSLTFTTLLALVPLLVVMLSVVAAFPMFHDWLDAFMAFINRMIVPSGASAIADYLDDFKSQTGKLTALGIGGMMVTSLLLLQTVEQTFNRIWRVQQQRNWWIRFPMYWLVLTLGPLVAGLGLSLSTYVHISGSNWFSGGLKIIWPVLYTSLFLLIIYRIVPNCTVRTTHAFTGALLTAIALETAKWGFGVYVTNFNSYALIYGTFAIVPVFLVWLHLLWVIVLGGALLTACIAYWQRGTFEENTVFEVSWQDAISILDQLAQAQQKGQELPLDAFRYRVYHAEKVLDVLTRWGYVVPTKTGWVLKTVADKIVLADVFTRTVGDDVIFRREMGHLEHLSLRDWQEHQS